METWQELHLDEPNRPLSAETATHLIQSGMAMITHPALLPSQNNNSEPRPATAATEVQFTPS